MFIFISWTAVRSGFSEFRYVIGSLHFFSRPLAYNWFFFISAQVTCWIFMMSSYRCLETIWFDHHLSKTQIFNIYNWMEIYSIIDFNDLHQPGVIVSWSGRLGHHCIISRSFSVVHRNAMTLYKELGGHELGHCVIDSLSYRELKWKRQSNVYSRVRLKLTWNIWEQKNGMVIVGVIKL